MKIASILVLAAIVASGKSKSFCQCYNNYKITNLKISIQYQSNFYFYNRVFYNVSPSNSLWTWKYLSCNTCTWLSFHLWKIEKCMSYEVYSKKRILSKISRVRRMYWRYLLFVAHIVICLILIFRLLFIILPRYIYSKSFSFRSTIGYRRHKTFEICQSRKIPPCQLERAVQKRSISFDSGWHLRMWQHMRIVSRMLLWLIQT